MQGIKAMLSRRALVLLAATTLGVLGMTGVAAAATYNVNDPGDYAQASGHTDCYSTHGGTCTLRAAVQSANEQGGANTINLPANTYPLTQGSLEVNTPNGGTNITVNGAGSSNTILNAQDYGSIFSVDYQGGLSLHGMTLENGDSSEGGAVYSDGALNINGDVTFKGNYADYGGAIYSDTDTGSTLSVTGAIFDGNSGDIYGGGIYDDSPTTANVSSSQFTNNSTEYGGAIAGEYGGLNADGNLFAGNTAFYDGGGIYWDNNTSVSVTNSTMSNNSAEYGGFLYDGDSASTSVSGSQLSGNAAYYYGGALYLDANSTTAYTVDHNEFNGNTATDEGGAIYWNEGTLQSNGSSFIGNNGGYDGGALYADAGYSLTLINATMSRNHAEYGGGIYFGTTTPAAINNNTIAYNSAAGSGDGGGVYEPADVTRSGYAGPGTAGVQNTIVAENVGSDCNQQFSSTGDNGYNLDSDGTCFNDNVANNKINTNPLLGQPADNGGPVLTDAELAGSPAIDAGTNTGCPATDARGVTRPQGASCDMGAFEAAAANLSLTKTQSGSATAGSAFSYTLKVSNGGPGISTGTTVADQLPAGETLYAATPSQGSCSTSGTKVTCSLGNLANGSSATVTLIVSEANVGSVKNTAAASNDQGSVVFASVTTVISAAGGGSKPQAITGPARNIKSTSAKLTGTVKTLSSTGYFFQYGKSKRYGLGSTLRRLSKTANVAAFPGGLKPNTVYHYRLVAVNTAGTSYGRDRSFRTGGHVFLGSLLLDSRTLHVRNGSVYAPFTCKSSKACTFRFTIVIHATLKNGNTATLVFTKSATRLRTIGAHQTVTEVVGVQPTSLSVLKGSSTGRIPGKLTTRPRTNQRGLIKFVTLVNG
jgi:uncharacterized repeat protein (TIGR01451 family)